MTALTDARARRDQGMEAAAEAERRDQPEYAPALYAAILTVASRQKLVHVDDVLPLLTVKPRHPNAAGLVWKRAMADGIIVATGRTRQCRADTRKRAHNSPVYASGLFGRAVKPIVPGRRTPQPTGLPGQIDLFQGGAL